MGQGEIRVSVLVSTRNRCDKLRLFLDAMKSSGATGLTPTEVLIIDNGSSDSTKEVVAEYVSLENPMVRYRLESRPGKSRAINEAICEARGDIIALTDDDCIPAPDWIESIVREFDADGDLSVLGGRVELYNENDLPQATLLSRNRSLVTNGWAICTRPTIIGANMAFRREALDAIDGFDPLLGPGTICKAAEDLDVIYRSLRHKFKIAYSPEVIVLHNHGRQTEEEDDQTSLAYGLGRGAFYTKNILRFDVHIAHIACREVYDLLKTLTKGVITRTKTPYHRLTFRAIFLGVIYYCKERVSQD